MVSAPVMIKEKGIILSEVKRDKSGVFDGYIKLTVTTDNQTRSIAGTVFSDGKPRFIQIKDINLDADVGSHMVYITNTDVPGMIGFIGTTLGDAGVNIANFQLGRNTAGRRCDRAPLCRWRRVGRPCSTSCGPTRRSGLPSRWCSTSTDQLRGFKRARLVNRPACPLLRSVRKDLCRNQSTLLAFLQNGPDHCRNLP